MSKVGTRRKNIDSASRVYATETNHSQSIADECIPAYEDLKKHKYKFVIYKIGRDSKIYVEQEGENYPGSEHVDFTKTLPRDECRYAAYSFDYEYGSEQAKRSKLLLVFWAPDLARVKDKMIYATNEQILTKNLVGYQGQIRPTDESELSREYFMSEIGRD